jgi:CBS domain containing-hemolysin-like protein
VSVDLVSWAVHPVTIGIAVSALVLLYATIEVLLGGLGLMGNIRFQGMLEDHDDLLPVGDDGSLPLAPVLSVLRWLQIASLLALAVVVFWLVAGRPGVTLLVLAVSAIVLTVVMRPVASRASELALVRLLYAVRPLMLPVLVPLVRIGIRERHVREYQSPPEEEDEEASEREIRAFIDVGHEAGIIEGEEAEFLESLVEFFDTTVREVMTPRTAMVAVSDDTDFDTLLQTFSATGKSRVPVYHETIDRVVGVAHVKDALHHLQSGRRGCVAELMRDIVVVPEGKRLGELLQEFQRSRQQLAIVADEWGGTAGLVTLEDALEEIVGEIQDEHDGSEPPEWEELTSGAYKLLGRASLEVLEELFGLDLEEEEMDTVGGLVFALHGTVPEVGDEVEDSIHGLRFTVEDMEERRIVAVKVVRAPTVDDGVTRGHAG